MGIGSCALLVWFAAPRTALELDTLAATLGRDQALSPSALPVPDLIKESNVITRAIARLSNRRKSSECDSISENVPREALNFISQVNGRQFF